MKNRSAYHIRNLGHASAMERVRKDILTVLVDSPATLTVLMNAYANVQRAEPLDEAVHIYQRRIADNPREAERVIRARAQTIVTRCDELLNPYAVKPTSPWKIRKVLEKPPIDPALIRMQLVDEMTDLRLPDAVIAAVPKVAMEQHRCDRAHAESLDAACSVSARLLTETKTAMTEANLRLINKFLYPYKDRPDHQDILQEGVFGLMNAVDRWDSKAGYRFSTYAGPYIRQAAQRAIAVQGSTIRIPVSVHTELNKLHAAENRFIERTGQIPDPDDMGQALDLPVGRIRRLRTIYRDDRPSDHRELYGSKWPEIGAEKARRKALRERPDNSPDPETLAMNTVMGDMVSQSLRTLTPREERVVRMRFGLEDGLEHTFEEVGQSFQVTRERIRQIEAKAVRKLRHPSRSRRLIEFAPYDVQADRKEAVKEQLAAREARQAEFEAQRAERYASRETDALRVSKQKEEWKATQQQNRQRQLAAEKQAELEEMKEHIKDPHVQIMMQDPRLAPHKGSQKTALSELFHSLGQFVRPNRKKGSITPSDK